MLLLRIPLPLKSCGLQLRLTIYYILWDHFLLSAESYVPCGRQIQQIQYVYQDKFSSAAAAAAAAVLSARDSLWPYPPVILAFWTLSEHDTPYWVL